MTHWALRNYVIFISQRLERQVLGSGRALAALKIMDLRLFAMSRSL